MEGGGFGVCAAAPAKNLARQSLAAALVRVRRRLRATVRWCRQASGGGPAAHLVPVEGRVIATRALGGPGVLLARINSRGHRPLAHGGPLAQPPARRRRLGRGRGAAGPQNRRRAPRAVGVARDAGVQRAPAAVAGVGLGGLRGGSCRASGGVASPGGGASSAGAGAGGGCVNVLGLPYRLVLAVATMDHVLLYDMQVNGVGCAWWGGGRGGGHIFK